MLCHSWRNTLPAARWHRSSALRCVVVMNQHEPTLLDFLAEGWLIFAIDLPVFYQATGEGNWKGQLHFRCACTCNPLRVVNSSMDSAFVCQVLVVQDWKTTARQRCASVFAVGNPSMSRYITNSSNVVHRTLINLQLGMVHSTHVWQIAGWFGMIKKRVCTWTAANNAHGEIRTRQTCRLNAHDVTIKEQLATPLFPSLDVLCSLIHIHELFVQARLRLRSSFSHGNHGNWKPLPYL